MPAGRVRLCLARSAPRSPRPRPADGSASHDKPAERVSLAGCVSAQWCGVPALNRKLSRESNPVPAFNGGRMPAEAPRVPCSVIFEARRLGRSHKLGNSTMAKSANDKTTPRRRAFASAGAALRISAAEFVAWQEGLGLSNGEAAAALYVSPNTVTAARRDGGGADIALKCRAVAAGISAADAWPDIWRLGRIVAAVRS